MGSGTASLLDALGRTVWTGTIDNGARIDVSHFAPGLYLLRIENEAGKETEAGDALVSSMQIDAGS